MEEKLLKQLTKKTLRSLKKEDDHLMHRVVFHCHKILSGVKHKTKTKHILLSTNPYINMNKSVEVTYWFDFLKEAESETVTPIIFSQILKVDDDDIAKGLNISVGTLRYRLGKALTKLGDIINP